MNANEARALLENIKRAAHTTYLGLGQALHAIHEGKGDKAMLAETDTIDGLSRWRCWEWWCREHLGMDPRTAWRYVEYYQICEALPEAHQKLLPAIPMTRVIDLGRKDRKSHPDFPRVLESASTLSARDFEVEVRRLDGATEDEAEDQTEERRKQAREHINPAHLKERSQLNRHVWKSEEFRKWVREQPCIFTGDAERNTLRSIEPAHIHSKGSGGDDLANVVPVRADLHRWQHDHSWDALLEKYGKDWDWLYGSAERVLIEYLTWLEGGKK